mmetsp:Transcript_14103/g.31199  ORF Transcript_14103/g.31199 Transcript_14103/m.31199 type:complete len:225 (+) Transcript_14103:124-798(+)
MARVPGLLRQQHLEPRLLGCPTQLLSSGTVMIGTEALHGLCVQMYWCLQLLQQFLQAKSFARPSLPFPSAFLEDVTHVFSHGAGAPREVGVGGKHGDAQRAPGRQQIYHGHQGLLDAASRQLVEHFRQQNARETAHVRRHRGCFLQVLRQLAPGSFHPRNLQLIHDCQMFFCAVASHNLNLRSVRTAPFQPLRRRQDVAAVGTADVQKWPAAVVVAIRGDPMLQ